MSENLMWWEEYFTDDPNDGVPLGDLLDEPILVKRMYLAQAICAMMKKIALIVDFRKRGLPVPPPHALQRMIKSSPFE